MERIINLGIPHIGEKVFEYIEVPDLIEYRQVSQAWKTVAETVLVQRWKESWLYACECGVTEVVEVLLTHPKS